MPFTDSAKIDLPRISTAAGSVSTAMPFNTALVEMPDEIDAEIARMSDDELIKAVLASAGSWADRNDLEFILDRSDRIDDIYASDTPGTSV